MTRAASVIVGALLLFAAAGLLSRWRPSTFARPLAPEVVGDNASSTPTTAPPDDRSSAPAPTLAPRNPPLIAVPSSNPSNCSASLLALLTGPFDESGGLLLDEDVGLPLPVLSGYIFEVGLGANVSMTRVTVGGAPLRGPSLARIISEVLREVSQHTVLYLAATDVDFWTLTDQPRFDSLRQRMHALMDRCPLWLLAWNPCGADEQGRLGRRTIPIPDSKPWPDPAHRSSALSQRTGCIAWRGVTTGHPSRSYTESDRFRAVWALHNLTGADVKFTRRLQNVTPSVVPGSMMGQPMTHEAMLRFRLQLDVDGNANAWSGLRWKLMGGGSVVKVRSSRRCVQWFYPLLQDGTHVKLLDLINASQFAGDVLALCHRSPQSEGAVARLSEGGRTLALRHLSWAAAYQYLHRTVRFIHARWPELESRDWSIRNATTPPLTAL